MKRLGIAIGLLMLAIGAATPVRADYAVIKFSSGYCRVWDGTLAGPEDGRYLWFPYRWHHRVYWHYRFLTLEGAEHAMHRAVWWHRCYHW